MTPPHRRFRRPTVVRYWPPVRYSQERALCSPRRSQTAATSPPTVQAPTHSTRTELPPRQRHPLSFGEIAAESAAPVPLDEIDSGEDQKDSADDLYRGLTASVQPRQADGPRRLLTPPSGVIAGLALTASGRDTLPCFGGSDGFWFCHSCVRQNTETVSGIGYNRPTASG